MQDRVEIRQGWMWPKDDVRCWRCFQKQKDLPAKVMEYVKNKSICVQAGGNVGVYVKKFADFFNKVYTFEPEAINYYCMEQNLKTNTNVVMHCGFLGNRNETAKEIVRFDTKKDPNTGKFKISKTDGNIPVHAIDQLNLESCDLIQLDIEGYEPQALLGAVETIKKFKPTLCLEWFENQQELSKILKELDYKEVADFRSDRVFVSN